MRLTGISSCEFLFGLFVLLIGLEFFLGQHALHVKHGEKSQSGGILSLPDSGIVDLEPKLIF